MFYSQYKQDEFLENTVFKGYKNGFFVDVGAHDGKTINNTLYFELNNNWKGINIEPIEKIYNNLLYNRPKCINLNCAIDEKNGKTEFIYNLGHTEMLSGIKNYYDKRHIDRLENENKQYNSKSEIIEINTKRLENIFIEFNIKHINYLSIDVEGAEFAVIKSINFDNIFIDVIGFENNYNDLSYPIIEYLENKNFKILNNTMHDIFMIHKDSKFLTF